MEAIARLGAAECSVGDHDGGDASYAGAAATPAPTSACAGSSTSRSSAPTNEEIATRFEANRDRVADRLSDRVRIGVSPHSVFGARSSCGRPRPSWACR